MYIFSERNKIPSQNQVKSDRLDKALRNFFPEKIFWVQSQLLVASLAPHFNPMLNLMGSRFLQAHLSSPHRALHYRPQNKFLARKSALET